MLAPTASYRRGRRKKRTKAGAAVSSLNRRGGAGFAALCVRAPSCAIESHVTGFAWLALRERLPPVRAWLPPEDFAEPPLDLLAPAPPETTPPSASINVPDSTHFSNEVLMHCSAASPAILAIEYYHPSLIALRSRAAPRP